MGLEAYLFQLNFKKWLTANKISSTLKKLDFKRVKSDLFTINFELISDEGIIECQLFSLIPFSFYIPTRKSLFFRFCVSNPPTVIEQSIILITKINELLGGTIVDVQHHKLFRINDPADVRDVTERILTQKKGFDALFGKIDQPIRCDDAWNYLEKYGNGKWSSNFPKKEHKFSYPTTKHILLRLSGCLGLPQNIEKKTIHTLTMTGMYTEKELINLLIKNARQEKFEINQKCLNQITKQKTKESLFNTYYKHKKCPECKSENVFKDKESEEIVCRDCSLVINQIMRSKSKQKIIKND